MIKKLEEFETTWTPTLNAAHCDFMRLFDDVSTAKKLSLEEKHKYFFLVFSQLVHLLSFKCQAYNGHVSYCSCYGCQAQILPCLDSFWALIFSNEEDYSDGALLKNDGQLLASATLAFPLFPNTQIQLFFQLDLMDSYHSLAIALYTSTMTMEKVVNYFHSLTFDTAPPMRLFFKEDKPYSLPLPAKRCFNDSTIPEHYMEMLYSKSISVRSGAS